MFQVDCPPLDPSGNPTCTPDRSERSPRSGGARSDPGPRARYHGAGRASPARPPPNAGPGDACAGSAAMHGIAEGGGRTLVGSGGGSEWPGTELSGRCLEAPLDDILRRTGADADLDDGGLAEPVDVPGHWGHRPPALADHDGPLVLHRRRFRHRPAVDRRTVVATVRRCHERSRGLDGWALPGRHRRLLRLAPLRHHRPGRRQRRARGGRRGVVPARGRQPIEDRTHRLAPDRSPGPAGAARRYLASRADRPDRTGGHPPFPAALHCGRARSSRAPGQNGAPHGAVDRDPHRHLGHRSGGSIGRRRK